jgi:hypothetical protein
VVILPAVITVVGPKTNVASAGLGLGLIQVPRYRVEADVSSGLRPSDPAAAPLSRWKALLFERWRESRASDEPNPPPERLAFLVGEAKVHAAPCMRLRCG